MNLAQPRLDRSDGRFDLRLRLAADHSDLARVETDTRKYNAKTTCCLWAGQCFDFLLKRSSAATSRVGEPSARIRKPGPDCLDLRRK
jgi:hypothetical protein